MNVQNALNLKLGKILNQAGIAEYYAGRNNLADSENDFCKPGKIIKVISQNTTTLSGNVNPIYENFISGENQSCEQADALI